MNWATRWSDMQPTSKIPDPIQDPKLFEPTKVRVLRSFCVRGRAIEVGEEVEVEFHVAQSLRATGRCEFVT